MSGTSSEWDFSVRTSTGSYDVRIGRGALTERLTRGGLRFAILDARFATGLTGLPAFTVHATEASKCLATVEDVIVALSDAGVRRGDEIIAIGGGVVQDVATLTASIYLRGIKWWYAPTTLMAMADSCLGGKSSINAAGAKNVVGNIYPPSGVVVDPTFTGTLPTIALVSGVAEATKICFCRGAETFTRYLAALPGSLSSETDFTEVINVTLRAKRWFIERDEFDHAERRILNFGHTFGHALEAATEFRVPHGVAVGLGMLGAVQFAGEDTSSSQLHDHLVRILGHVDQLPELVCPVDWDRFAAAFGRDKKHAADTYRLILPRGGDVELIELPMDGGVVERAVSAVHDGLCEVGVSA